MLLSETTRWVICPNVAASLCPRLGSCQSSRHLLAFSCRMCTFERFTRSKGTAPTHASSAPLSCGGIFSVFRNLGSNISSQGEGEAPPGLTADVVLQTSAPSESNNTGHLKRCYLWNVSLNTELCRESGSGSYPTPGTGARLM